MGPVVCPLKVSVNVPPVMTALPNVMFCTALVPIRPLSMPPFASLSVPALTVVEPRNDVGALNSQRAGAGQGAERTDRGHHRRGVSVRLPVPAMSLLNVVVLLTDRAVLVVSRAGVKIVMLLPARVTGAPGAGKADRVGDGEWAAGLEHAAAEVTSMGPSR